MSSKPQVNDEELWVMLMSTVRHALGRRTYLPRMVLGFCEKFFPRLTAYQRAEVIEEIESALLRTESATTKLGDESTDQTWRDGLETLKDKAQDLDKA